MTNRLPKHLHDALAAAQRAEQFLGALDVDGYRANVLVRSAVERQLEILGEACKRVLDDAPGLKTQAPALGLAIGLRNQIIHGYDRIVDAVVVDTIRRDLPDLQRWLAEQLARFPAP